jgi:hypothetical protein
MNEFTKANKVRMMIMTTEKFRLVINFRIITPYLLDHFRRTS